MYVCVCAYRVLVGHPDNDPNRLCVECTGTEGVADVADRFEDQKPQYALGMHGRIAYNSRWIVEL